MGTAASTQAGRKISDAKKRNKPSLELVNTNLIEIPKSIFELQQLKKLVLSGNLLESLGDLPRLSLLEELDISTNEFHELPRSILKLSNLKVLKADFNDIKKLPDLSCLSQLHTLSLRHNTLVRLDDHIANVKKLRKLYIDNNFLDELPSSLGSLSELEILSFQLNRIHSIPNELANLSSLKEIYALRNKIRELPNQVIAKWQNLEVLEMDWNRLESLPAELFTLTNLKALHLRGNQLDNSSIPQNVNLPALKILAIKKNKFATMPSIQGMPGLTELDLRYNPLDTIDLKAIKECKSLQSVTLATKQLKDPAAAKHNVVKVWDPKSQYTSILNKTVDKVVELQPYQDKALVKKCLPKIHLIIPGLYLTSKLGAYNYDKLLELGITHIVSATAKLKFPNEFLYYLVDVADNPLFTEMVPHFTNCNRFISNGMKLGKVLVHCAAGVSRSATIIIAYLVSVEGWKLQTAVDHVTRRRIVAHPNSGFWQQLMAYEREVAEIDSQRFVFRD